MSSTSNPPLRDVAILTRAVENVFRKLIRMLIGKMSLKKLQEMIQIIFVEEAEEKLKIEAPGKNVALSALAVITGFDTRTITKIKSKDSYLKPFHTAERFINEITPECSVLDVWESSQKYIDTKSGKPKTLKIKDSKTSFESLISDSVSARGITVKSVLQRLEASKSIIIVKDKNEVQMIDKRYTPFESRDQIANVEIGMVAVGNLVDTITHNLDAPSESKESFYQRGCWTNRLNRSDSDELRDIIRRFLSTMDNEARKIMRPFEQDVASSDQVTAGISTFYFEEEIQN